MKNLAKNLFTFLISLIGFIGGCIWAYESQWQMEPIILVFISFVEIISYFVLSYFFIGEGLVETSTVPANNNEQKVDLKVNIFNGERADEKSSVNPINNQITREACIDSMKTRTNILFIDDDENFNVVQILKDSGWKYTYTTIDIKSIDIPQVRRADVLFVDINGVGKLLKLTYEGLDLALMLKQKYPNKKVIIYSANKNSNSFHEAWNKCDFKLEKNALPYEFQNLVETFSIENFSKLS